MTPITCASYSVSILIVLGQKDQNHPIELPFENIDPLPYTERHE